MARQKVKNVEVTEPVESVETVETQDTVESVETVETQDTVEQPTLVTGMVANCVKLNIRKKPDPKAAVIAMLDRNEKVTVDVANSTDGWFKVAFGNVKEAYCMKEYIKID